MIVVKKKIIIAICVVSGISFGGGLYLCKKNFSTFHISQTGHVHSEGVEKNQSEEEHEGHEKKKEIKLTEEQIKRLNIHTLTLKKSHFQHRITLPGQVTLNENTITHVVAPVPGVAKDIFKGLGETIKIGEPLATLQSRDMAEAKSDYISAYKNLALKKDLFEREEKLWKLKIKAEIEFIQTKYIYENAKIDLEEKKQKLLALNMPEDKIQKLPEQRTALNIYTIDSPIEGKVIERHITLGEVISTDKQVFVIANLDTVWVNLAIPAEDLPKIKKNQKADIFGHQGETIQTGIIMYISPVINDESRTGRAVIQLDNTNHLWRPGDFITAQVIMSEQSNCISLLRSAIQTIDGIPFVFVKTGGDLFEAKPIQIKGADKNEFVEILSGIKEGDEIAIKNTFLLKAELGKSEAEHSH